jgi:hypothetical protein
MFWWQLRLLLLRGRKGMPRVMRNAVLALLAWGLLGSSVFSAQDVLRVELEQAYQSVIKASSSGIEAQLRETISSYMYSEVKGNYASAARPFDAQAVRTFSKLYPDIRKLPFVKTLLKGPTAALVYVADSAERDATAKPRVQFTVIRFVLEESRWRLDGFGRIGSLKYRDDGTVMEFSESLLPPRLAVDGKVRAPLPIPPAAERVGRLDVMSYGYETTVIINDRHQGSTKNRSSSALVKGGLRKGENRVLIEVVPLADSRPALFSVSIHVLETTGNSKEVLSLKPGGPVKNRYDQVIRVE